MNNLGVFSFLNNESFGMDNVTNEEPNERVNLLDWTYENVWIVFQPFLEQYLT